MVVVENGCGVLGHGTLKSAVLKNELRKWADFMHADANLRVGMVKNGRDHGTLKSSASPKWFDELSRLIEWFLNAGIFGLNQ